MWTSWKTLFMSCINKHAPLRNKRICKKKSPWITADLRRKMRNRDFTKKKAIRTNDQSWWDQYKIARNQTNNSIKNAKRRYFTDNLDANKRDPRKTWKLINELRCRQQKSVDISELELGDRKITCASELSEAFNHHFTNVGQTLVNEIPQAKKEPEVFLKPVNLQIRNSLFVPAKWMKFASY